jgi:hypothetical protein
MKLLFTVSVMVFVATSAMAQIVKAQAFVLIDADGNPRGEFMMTDDGPSLLLCDNEDNTVIEISVTKTHSIVRIYDTKSKKLGFTILVAETVGAMLGFGDQNNTPRLDLGMTDFPFLHIYDANGKQIWRAPQ